jgi:hypothetical protein
LLGEAPSIWNQHVGETEKERAGKVTVLGESANVACEDMLRDERKGRDGDDTVCKVDAPPGGIPGLFTRLLQTLVDRRSHSILLNAGVRHGKT